MGNRLLSNAQLRTIQKKVGELIDGFSTETIQIHLPSSSSSCPDCEYDWMSRASKDPNCPTCKGKGIIYTDRVLPIKALASGITEDMMRFNGAPAGVKIGDTLLMISWKEMKELVVSVEDLRKSEYIVGLPGKVTEYGEITEFVDSKWKCIGEILPTVLYQNLIMLQVYISRVENAD